MTVTAPSPGVTWQETRRFVLPATLVGTFLEWFDMFVYAQAAALIFPKLFFPTFSPLAGTLASFATFGVGYLARPIGAIVFGHIGDRHGRRFSLICTLILMGGATVLVGCLPTYSAIGIGAAVLLVVLRLAQGLGSGAEYAGSLTMVAEIAPPARRGFWTAVPGSGIYAGQMLAAIIGVTVFSVLPKSSLLTWGWRLPFLLSVVLIIVGVLMRLRIGESPVFEKMERQQTIRKVPALTVFHRAPLRLVLSIALTMPIAFNAYMTSTYGLTFSVSRGVSNRDALIGTILGTGLTIFLVPLSGYLSDRFGRKRVFLTTCALGGLAAFPYFALLDTGDTGLLWLAQLVLVAPTILSLTGAQAAFLPELFASAYRYSGVAMSRELSTAGLTSVTPIVGLALVAALHGQPWLVAAAMVVVSLISFVAVSFLPETRGVELTPDAATTATNATATNARAAADA
jgi:MFS family permease